MAKTITTTITGAYKGQMTTLENIPFTEMVNGEQATHYKNRIIIEWDLKDGENSVNHLVPDRHREYWSESFNTKMNAAEITAWITNNLPLFIAAGKLEFANYGA